MDTDSDCFHNQITCHARGMTLTRIELFGVLTLWEVNHWIDCLRSPWNQSMFKQLVTSSECKIYSNQALKSYTTRLHGLKIETSGKGVVKHQPEVHLGISPGALARSLLVQILFVQIFSLQSLTTFRRRITLALTLTWMKSLLGSHTMQQTLN